MTILSGTRPSFDDRSRRRSSRSAWFAGLALAAMSASFVPVGIANAGTSTDPLLASLRSQDVRSLEFPSTSLRKTVAETLLGDCNVALTHVPRQTPVQGLTEERPGDITEMRREFARWRLSAIFGDCTGMTRDVLAAHDVQQEMRAWIRLARLLDDEQTIRNLIAAAGIPSSPHDETDVETIIGISHWRDVRHEIYDAMLRFMDRP